MLPRGHIIASGIFSICVWVYFKSIGCAAISFAAGVLLDLDHLIDYYANHSFTLNIKDVYNACLEIKLNKLFLLLHSYELIAILWLAIFVFGLSNSWKALAVGCTQHILIDQITNPIKLTGYFLTYRIAKGFKKELILR